MDLYETGYKFHCHIPVGKVILMSFLYILLVGCTAGLALPFCLFSMGEILINHSQLAKQDESSDQ
jgi:hypothetical protein